MLPSTPILPYSNNYADDKHEIMKYLGISTVNNGSENDDNLDGSSSHLQPTFQQMRESLFQNNVFFRMAMSSSYSLLHRLSNGHAEIIQRLVLLQEVYDSPSEEDFSKITPFSSVGSDCKKHVMELITLIVGLTIDFARRVPGYDTISVDDRITLFKASSIEVMFLWMARKYDPNTNSTGFSNNHRYTRENFRNASMGEFSNCIFEFCRRMYHLKVANAEYALLTCIVIFSSRSYVVESKKVEKLQELYIQALRAYLVISRPAQPDYFEQLLLILDDLRKVGNRSAQQWLSTHVYYQKIPPLLVELLGMQE